MAFQWPCFANPVSVDTDRSWTAEFESYDQRNEECYYIVTLQEPGRTSRRIMAKVGIGRAGQRGRGAACFARRTRRIIGLFVVLLNAG